MEIKTLLFDLDGVLFDGREFHRKMFMDTVLEICPKCIDDKYHACFLDGLSTKQKITHLIHDNKVSSDISSNIYTRKQELTTQYIGQYIHRNTRLISLFEDISKKYKIICVSNAIKQTVHNCLNGLGITDFFDDIISNEDCIENKPSPQPYITAFQRNSIVPFECIIFEDSYGRTSAYMSGAWVVPIVDVHDMTLDKIYKNIRDIQACRNNITVTDINIVIPMAGLGSRFQKAGYTCPKPFIQVFDKPMIQWVIENMIPHNESYGSFTPYTPFSPTFHFIVQQSHLDQFDFRELCDSLKIKYTITTIDRVTEGAACTVLLVKDKINTDIPLVTVNSDQYLEWDQNEFYRALTNPYYDGCINVFEQVDPNDVKWSYSKIDDNGEIQEVAEKKYISQWATTGVYGWKKGSDFVHYAEEMVAKNIRVNNEFYVCPVYNEAISDKKHIRNYLCKKIWGLGVPEDLETFLQKYTYEPTH